MNPMTIFYIFTFPELLSQMLLVYLTSKYEHYVLLIKNHEG